MTKRIISAWLYAPVFLTNILLSKIFRYIPSLNFSYLVLSARIDTGKSLGGEKRKHVPIKLKLSDVKNRKMRYSLFLSGIFKKWNIYYIRNIGEMKTCNIQDNKRDVIYITKDILTENDIIHGERFSDWKINHNYEGKKSKKFFRSINLEYDEFYKIEPQIYVISALDSFRHKEMRIERDIKYKKDCYKDLTKKVKKSISDDNLFGSYQVKGYFNRTILFHNVIRSNRIDLAKLMLNSCYDIQEKQKLVIYKVDSDGHQTKYSGTSPIDIVVSDEMKELILKWTDLEQFERVQKIMKIKKGIINS